MDISTLNCEAAYYKDFIDASSATIIFNKITQGYLFNEQFLATQPNHLRIPETDKIMFMDRDIFLSCKLPNEQWGKTAIWFEELEKLRNRIEKLLNWPFQIGVCIYYCDGNTGIDFHSDPPAFGNTEVIASISLGAERIFQLRDNETKQVYEELLHHGSLFVMGKGSQQKYEHSLPYDSTCKEPRINITFRTYGYDTQKLH